MGELWFKHGQETHLIDMTDGRRNSNLAEPKEPIYVASCHT